VTGCRVVKKNPRKVARNEKGIGGREQKFNKLEIKGGFTLSSGPFYMVQKQDTPRAKRETTREKRDCSEIF